MYVRVVITRRTPYIILNKYPGLEGTIRPYYGCLRRRRYNVDTIFIDDLKKFGRNIIGIMFQDGTVWIKDFKNFEDVDVIMKLYRSKVDKNLMTTSTTTTVIKPIVTCIDLNFYLFKNV